MSGGVDSSVAAALLKSDGYEVVGITLCFNLPDSSGRRPSCCGIRGIEDAKRVAHKLGIKHYALNFKKLLEEKVVKEFCLEYSKGRTPNPCVRCNQYIKFDALLKRTAFLGAAYLATGHYARIIKNSKYSLRKGRDRKKDQSYFLYRLGQRQLKRILFPLGGYTKDEVRKIARDFSLPVAEKLGSQEICFIPDADYRSFLKARSKKYANPGPILDGDGNILGRHNGVAFYTIGQREGLGIAMGYPVYVTKIDPRANSITVGRKEDVYADEFTLRDTHLIFPFKKKKVALKVRIRYNHSEAPAVVTLAGNKARVKFKEPQFAVTPGQSAVFYDKDKVLGGGIIDRMI